MKVPALHTPRVLLLGELDYALSHAQMSSFTNARDEQTRDEFWVLSHPPVYTQGTSCDAQPRPSNTDIPLLKTDRGGQITYHGPGQLVIYLMLDIKRLGIGPKRLVRQIEQAIIRLLRLYQIQAGTRDGAPGVYVNSRKIAALGLRIRQGRTYHGLSLNIDMDLKPFQLIDPCGYAGLEITQMIDQGVRASERVIANQLIDCLIEAIYSSTSAD